MFIKIVRIIGNVKKSTPSHHADIDIPDMNNRPFDEIQDAEFEDLTPKPPDAPKQ